MTTNIENPEFRRLLAERMQALANPARIYILHLLMQKEHCVHELVVKLGISQASVSKHIAILYRHGFVNQQRQGNQIFYHIGNESLQDFCKFICRDLQAHLQKIGDLGKEETPTHF